MSKLAHLDQATGLPVRKPIRVRYEKQASGELVHVDIKKLGRLPEGGGWRTHGRGSFQDRQASNARHHGATCYCITRSMTIRGWPICEILNGEKKETAAGFWERARGFVVAAGIAVTAVMTDNGACYRSTAFAQALGPDVKHRRTRLYRPQTNGKIERFNRTLAQEWAYTRSYDSEEARAAGYSAWLHHYNHHRPDTGIGGLTRSDRVHNLTGNYT